MGAVGGITGPSGAPGVIGTTAVGATAVMGAATGAVGAMGDTTGADGAMGARIGALPLMWEPSQEPEWEPKPERPGEGLALVPS
jgi:hypothetical protein